MSSANNDSKYKNYSNLFVYSGANKAGMEEVDKEKQAQVIYEMSKNSAYFKKAAKLDEITDEKVKSIQLSINSISPFTENKLQNLVTQKSIELENRRCFEQICCVLDMDMFFAAVEIRDQPHLKELPVAVGGDMMISTANYVARKFGVRAAMPGFVAKKLCPHLVYVNCNFSKYEKVAEQIRSIIGEYDPFYRSHSLDEVYFDLTNASKKRFCENGNTIEKSTNSSSADCTDICDIVELRKVACDILNEIRRRIQEVTNGLTASAGIANNFFLAKICADINKPDGQYELGPNRDSVLAFVTALPTRKVGGIGKVTEKILSKLGMDTLGQVRANMYKVLHSFSPISSEFLLRVSLGVAEEEGVFKKSVVPAGAVTRKSIGCERTFTAKGISEPNELYDKLNYICGQVSKDMESEDLWGRTVTLKLKTISFDLLTRSTSTKQFIQGVQDIERLARQLLDQALPVSVRLMGVSVSKFKNAYDPSEEARGQRNVRQYFLEKSLISDSESRDFISMDSTKEKYSRDSGLQVDEDGFPMYDPLLYDEDDDTVGNACSNSNSCTTSTTMGCVELGDDPPHCESFFDAVVSRSQNNLLSYSQQQRLERAKMVDCVEERTEGDVVQIESSVILENAVRGAVRFSSNNSRCNSLLEKVTSSCPICGTEVYGTLVALNTHIDGCLSNPVTSSSTKCSISSYFQTKDSNSSVVDLIDESGTSFGQNASFSNHKRMKTEKNSQKSIIGMYFKK